MDEPGRHRDDDSRTPVIVGVGQVVQPQPDLDRMVDAAEGAAAFAEKRSSVWKGR